MVIIASRERGALTRTSVCCSRHCLNSTTSTTSSLQLHQGCRILAAILLPPQRPQAISPEPQLTRLQSLLVTATNPSANTNNSNHASLLNFLARAKSIALGHDTTRRAESPSALAFARLLRTKPPHASRFKSNAASGIISTESAQSIKCHSTTGYYPEWEEGLVSATVATHIGPPVPQECAYS